MQGTLCAPCWRSVNFISPPQCECCGLPLEFSTLAGTQLCGACILHPPSYTHARAIFRYEGIGAKLVTRLKYADKTYTVPTLAQWLQRAGSQMLSQADMLIPVPIHPYRLLRRRFNQSLLLARALSKSSAIPVVANALIRTRHTKPQAGLTRRQRLHNVKGAFAVPSEREGLIKGKHAVVVDDVMTTGATIAACSEALLHAGAQNVSVLTLARRA